MKRLRQAGTVVVGVCLAAVAAFGVQAAPPDAARPALRLLLNADLLDQPVFAQIQPRLEAFAAATDADDATAFGAFLAPGFRLVTKPGAGESGPKAAREAVSLLDYATGDGRPQDKRVSLTLSVRKFYPAPGRLGLLLDDEGGWAGPPKETRIGLTGREITRHWALTWVNADGDWKLLTLAYLQDTPVSASAPAPSTTPVPLVLVDDALATLSATGEILPQIQSYASTLDVVDMTGYRRFLTPDFRFQNRSDSFETGQKALRDALNLARMMRPDQTERLARHNVTITKLFQKPGALVLFVTNAMTYTPVKPTKSEREFTAFWSWKQTWINTPSGWRLRQVTEF